MYSLYHRCNVFFSPFLLFHSNIKRIFDSIAFFLYLFWFKSSFFSHLYSFMYSCVCIFSHRFYIPNKFNAYSVFSLFWYRSTSALSFCSRDFLSISFCSMESTNRFRSVIPMWLLLYCRLTVWLFSIAVNVGVACLFQQNIVIEWLIFYGSGSFNSCWLLLFSFWCRNRYSLETIFFYLISI